MAFAGGAGTRCTIYRRQLRDRGDRGNVSRRLLSFIWWRNLPQVHGSDGALWHYALSRKDSADWLSGVKRRFYFFEEVFCEVLEAERVPVECPLLYIHIDN